MAIIVGRLPANFAGRDIIIGDLHGHPEILYRLLEQAKFDPARDRGISTGDLVDRGPDSFGCLEFLNESWFFAVRGNHEQNLADMIATVATAIDRGQSIDDTIASLSDAVARMSSAWFPLWLASRTFDRQHMDALYTRIMSLPHILAVGDGSQRFNVVHADLAEADLASDERIDTAHGIQDSIREKALIWSRTAYRCLEDGYDAPATTQHLSLTFCGHNAVPLLMTWGRHMFIDTGCGYLASPDTGLSAVIVPTGEIIFEPMPTVIWGLENRTRKRMLIGDQTERISP